MRYFLEVNYWYFCGPPETILADNVPFRPSRRWLRETTDQELQVEEELTKTALEPTRDVSIDHYSGMEGS